MQRKQEIQAEQVNLKSEYKIYIHFLSEYKFFSLLLY